jgi:hypothetical protein
MFKGIKPGEKMPAKPITPKTSDPQKSGRQKAAPKKSAPKKPVTRKATPKKAAQIVEPVETIAPPVETAVPVEGTVEEPVIIAPAPVDSVEAVLPGPPPAPVPPTPPVKPVASVPIPAPVPPIPAVPSIPPQLSRTPLMKPGLVQTIAVMTMVNGILNILYGLIVTGAIVLGTFFIGIICAPVTILPAILGIFEIVYSVKLLADPPQPVKPSQSIAILEIIALLAGNVISAIVGVLALAFYADSNVKAYFARLNSRA